MGSPMIAAMESKGTLGQFLTPLDYIIFFTCLLITAGSIFYGHSIKGKIKAGHAHVLEHLLMGRTLTLPMFVATMVATWYGGIFGVTEIAFTSGVYNFLTQGVFWYLTYIVFAFFMVDRIAAYHSVTLPELVSKMFGPTAGRVAAVFNFFNVLPVAYTLSLGLFLQLLTGWSLLTSVSVGTVLVCTYSIMGGFRSDVFSDIVQFFVMCAAVFFVVAFSYATVGDWTFLKNNLPATHFEPMGGHGLATTMVWGLIAFATLVDPNFYQKCFAAKNPQTAKKGIFIATLIWFCFDICTTLGAMYARAMIPAADPKQSYLLYALQVLPNGFRGFFLAGIVAIVISTLDSYLIIASQSVSYDLVPKHWRENINIHRLSTVMVGLLAIGLSMVFDGSIKDVWKTLGSYSAGCLLLPMFCGFFLPGVVSERGFIVSTVLGAIAITYWRFAELTGFWQEVDEIYIGLVMTFVGIMVIRAFEQFRGDPSRQAKHADSL